MRRTRVRWGRVGWILGIGAVLLSLLGGAVAGARDGGGVYTVRPGDTVWTIARRLVGTRGDPRPAVEDLIQRNRLRDAVIRPGELLRLPGCVDRPCGDR